MLAAVMATFALAAPMQERYEWLPGSHQAPLSPPAFSHGGPEACLFRERGGRIELLQCALFDRPRRSIRSFYR